MQGGVEKMYLKNNFILFMFTLIFIIFILLFIEIESLKNKIKDIEERNLQVHEYILDKIGG